MKMWLQRVRKIARAHIPSRERFFSTEVPTWQYPQEEEARDSQAASVEAKVSREEEQYYANLELPVGSSFEEIKQQYRVLLRRYHPDLYAKETPEKQAAAEKVTAQLNAAYEYFKSHLLQKLS
jgi:DnaJ-domain-containing protein 1